MDETQNSGYMTIEVGTSMVLLATIAVSVRFISKTFTKARFSFDDYWIFLSLAFFWTYVGLLYWAVFKEGGGLDMPNVREKNLKAISRYTKALQVATPFFPLVTSTTKISLLLYYRRIFTTQKLQRAALILIVFTALSGLTQLLGVVFQCVPLRAVWDPLVAGHCMNFNIFVLVANIFDLLLDVCILCLPMSVIPHLHLPLKHRISLSMIFMLGGFVCITAIVRLALTYRPGSSKINVVETILWSNIHLGTAIICACLPTYRPILSQCGHGFTRIQSQYKSWFSSKQELAHGVNSQKLHSDQVPGKQDDREHILGVFTDIGQGGGSARSGDYPLDHIKVENSVSVV